MFLYEDYDSEISERYIIPPSIVECLALHEEEKTLDVVHNDVRLVLVEMLSKIQSAEKESKKLFTIKIY